MIEGEVLILRVYPNWPLARSSGGMHVYVAQHNRKTLMGMSLLGQLRCVY